MLLDAYGLQDRGDLLDMLRRRHLAIRDTITRKAEEGHPAYVQLRAEGRLTEITATWNTPADRTTNGLASCAELDQKQGRAPISPDSTHAISQSNDGSICLSAAQLRRR